MRISKTNLQYMLARYKASLKTLGQEADSLSLDCNFVYGGYKVVSIEEKGMETDILGSHRLSTREMYYALLLACLTLEAIIYKKKGQAR